MYKINMAKKVQSLTVVSSRLVIGKEELNEQIIARILKGKELLDYPVKLLSTKTDTWGNPYGVYDEKQQSNFPSTINGNNSIVSY